MEIYTGGVGVIVQEKDGTRILMGNRTDGQGWCLAGGKTEEGETKVEAAIRETKEEFGIDVDKKDLVLLGTIFGQCLMRGNPVNVVSAIYYTKTYSGSIMDSNDEMSEIRWINKNEVLFLDKIFNPSLCAINKYLLEIEPIKDLEIE